MPATATTIDKVYTFSGVWSPTIEVLTCATAEECNKEYEAQYEEAAREYTITFVDEGTETTHDYAY